MESAPHTWRSPVADLRQSGADVVRSAHAEIARRRCRTQGRVHRSLRHLLEAGIDASIGTVGDALDDALMESLIGLYKTELIKPRKPWRALPDVELATAEWVDWFNNQRLHTAIGSIPPHEHETNYYAQHQPQPAAGANA
ncbi:integrase core domain-containing protein [Streptomyces atroolivaceus]|uniref:integrase core domain-containing protein n=1 Tax=Streptomyces atroolivaceus TaxID=66869 RepID=UPI003F4E4333